MQAAVFTAYTGVDGVEIGRRPDPEPGPGEALVRVRACSLNRHDWKILNEGLGIGSDDPPFVAGVDLAGVIERTGPEVDLSPGDRVVRCPNLTCGACRFCREGPENRCVEYSLAHGGLAELATARADRLIELPESVGFEAAATLPVAYMTAYHMMRRADVGAADLVFVPGGAGSVGVAATALLDAVGASSVVTSTSARKLDRLASVGADHTVRSDDPDEIRDRLEELGPVDAVLNHLSGPYTQLGLDVLRRGGAMAICGQTAGSESTVDVLPMYLDHKSVHGTTMGTQPDLERAVGLCGSGALAPPVGEVYGLAETADAFRDLRDRESFGSLVVTP